MKNKTNIFVYYLGIGIGMIFIVSFLTSQIFMPLFFGRARTVEVPDLSKMTTTKAITTLINKKLHGVVKDSTWSEEIKSGFVISQRPEAGTMVKPDGTVYIVISRGSKIISVPNLVGLDVQAAWIKLKSLSLRFSIADSIYSGTYPRNTVVQTSPNAGDKVERNSKIKLYISKGFSNNIDSLDYESEYNF
ncbi:MAG: PASTA domain-containing protein [Candidatus Cloacimonetes bacterium]|nr:PASTA domain-containing protein [Candidatus Cloacimonadota bacterium]